MYKRLPNSLRERSIVEEGQFLFGSVDIGGTKIAVAAVDADFRIAARRQFPTNRDADFDRSVAKPDRRTARV